jgi:hypothetical protein
MGDERERGGDGLLIGILVLLAVLVIGGLGMGVVGFRFAAVERQRAIMVMEEARAAEMQARMQAEVAEQLAEQARANAEQAAAQATEPPRQDTDQANKESPGEAKPDPDSRDQ